MIMTLSNVKYCLVLSKIEYHLILALSDAIINVQKPFQVLTNVQ
jgi:hypothetical protein